MYSGLGVWFVSFLIIPHYQKQWVFPTGDFTFIWGSILNTYQDALAQESVPLYTFYNFPLTFTFLFLLLCSSSSCPCLPPLAVLPWRHCQLCTGPVTLIRWSCRIISLPPSWAPFYFLSSQGGARKGHHIEAEGSPSPIPCSDALSQSHLLHLIICSP